MIKSYIQRAHGWSRVKEKSINTRNFLWLLGRFKSRYDASFTGTKGKLHSRVVSGAGEIHRRLQRSRAALLSAWLGCQRVMLGRDSDAARPHHHGEVRTGASALHPRAPVIQLHPTSSLPPAGSKSSHGQVSLAVCDPFQCHRALITQTSHSRRLLSFFFFFLRCGPVLM